MKMRLTEQFDNYSQKVGLREMFVLTYLLKSTNLVIFDHGETNTTL